RESARMTEFLKMDIFFVIATIGTVVVAVLAAIALWYLVRILKTFDRLTREVEEEAKAIRADIHEARAAVHAEGKKIEALVDLGEKSVTRFFGGRKRKRSS